MNNPKLPIETALEAIASLGIRRDKLWSMYLTCDTPEIGIHIDEFRRLFQGHEVTKDRGNGYWHYRIHLKHENVYIKAAEKMLPIPGETQTCIL
jgi:hypothetical protein